MSRYRNIGYLADDVLREDLDTGFVGVNNRLSPALLRQGAPYYDVNRSILGPGLLSDGVNTRVSRGEPETRGCVVQVPHFNPSGLAEIFAAEQFTDPDTATDYAVLAAGSGAWVCKDGTTPVLVAYPSGETLATGDSADLVQAFNKLFLFRGEGKEVLVWEGDTGAAFRKLSSIPVTFGGGDYTDAMPQADWATVAANRLVAPYGRDQLAVSEILDFTRWDRALNTFRVQGGEHGKITAAAPFRRTRLVVFKEEATYIITGFEGDLSASALEGVNSEVGCIARRTVQPVGGDLFWLGHGGVYRMSETVELGMSTQEVPVSDPVQGWVDRVNWTYASASAAAVQGRYYFLSVPLDDSTVPNAMLVYDTVSREWQGMDYYGDPDALGATATEIELAGSGDQVGNLEDASGAGHHPGEFFHSRYLGKNTLFSVDLARGRAVAHEQPGWHDYYGGGHKNIHTRITTRGYLFGDMGFKKPRSVSLNVGTQGASVTLDVLTDGANESESLVTGRTASPSDWLLAGRAARQLDNSADDHNEPGRADYQVLGSHAAQTGYNGIRYDTVQQTTHRYPVRGREGRWVAFRLKSSTGYLRLEGVHADGIGAGHHTSNAA